MDTKYRSRKFLVTLLSLLGTFALAYMGKMTGDVAMVVSVCAGMYNYAQGKIDERAQP